MGFAADLSFQRSPEPVCEVLRACRHQEPTAAIVIRGHNAGGGAVAVRALLLAQEYRFDVGSMRIGKSAGDVYVTTRLDAGVRGRSAGSETPHDDLQTWMEQA